MIGVEVDAMGLRGRAAAKRAAAALVAIGVREMQFRYRFESLEGGSFEMKSGQWYVRTAGEFRGCNVLMGARRQRYRWRSKSRCGNS